MPMEVSTTLASTATKTLYAILSLPPFPHLTLFQIYVGKLGNAYFKNGEVAGQTDFFYGFGTAWVEQTSIALRSCGGGITAWKGTNTTFVNKYGVYIVDSNIHAANATVAANIVGKCALGRPWVCLLFPPYFLSYSLSSIDFSSSPECSNARHLRTHIPRRFHPFNRLHRLVWHTAILTAFWYCASGVQGLRTGLQCYGTSALVV